VAADWFGRLPVDLRTSLLGDYSRSWSAGSITFDGMLNVVANPEHSEARRTITLLEELVHEGLGHPKSQLIVQDGIAMRTCQHDVEDEAYAVAAALVMPYRDLFNHLNAGRPLADLTVPAPVSDECRLYRVKRAGLWKLYIAREGHPS
jgi:Zn-dependent peptidase ImmA (M78 family)